MKNDWASLEEVMRATGWSARTLQRKTKRGELRFRASGPVLLNGRRERVYEIKALPPDAQGRLWAARGCAVEEARVSPAAPIQLALPGVVLRKDAEPGARVVLPDAASLKQANDRLQILRPILDFIAHPKTHSDLRFADGRPVDSLRSMSEYVSAQHGIGKSTLLRWLAAYREGGHAALADRVRRDKGQSRWFAQNRNAAMLAAFLYLDQRMGVSFVHEELGRSAELLGLNVEDQPSYETVRVFLSREISPAMRTLAREGRKVYRERMAPYLKRGHIDVPANAVWIGDHMIHDVEVANDLFTEQPFGTPIRLRLSAFMDYRSRRLVGATWAWEGSSRSIAASMKRGILRFGPPERLYVDNGKDYRKIAKGAPVGLLPEGWRAAEWDAIEKTGFLARIGAAVTHCLPHHPQSKSIERFFGTLHERFDAVHSTYTSGSPFSRPELTEQAMMRHRRLLRAGRAEESEHPLASRFILGCLSWIEEYNATPHSGEGMEGCSPNQVFEETLNPKQRPAPEPTTLAMLMADYERRRVRECAVTLRRHRYTPRPEDRVGWAALHEMNEREVLIAYDPGDLYHAAALDIDGHFLAWLEAEELIRFAPGDRLVQAQIADSMSTRRGLEKATRMTLRAIATEARSIGARSAEEMLYSRLQLPDNAGPVITQRRAKEEAPAAPTRLVPGQAAEELAEMLRAAEEEERPRQQKAKAIA